LPVKVMTATWIVSACGSHPADNLQGSCHDGTSLSAGNGGEAPTVRADKTLMRLYPSSY
jgi:hypothetical protein